MYYDSFPRPQLPRSALEEHIGLWQPYFLCGDRKRIGEDKRCWDGDGEGPWYILD